MSDQVRGRRVTDKLDEDALTLGSQALKLEGLRGSHLLLAQRVDQSISHMTDLLSGLQQDVRQMTSKIGEVANLQQSHDLGRDSMQEIKASVAEIGRKMEQWFDDITESNERRWQVYEHNRNMWRQQHEAENEDTKRELTKEIRNVRETVMRVMGWGGGAGALVTIVVAGFMFWLNQRFDNVQASVTATMAAHERNRDAIEQEKDKRHEIELYLARGGVNSRDPYQPSKEKPQ